VLAARSRQRDGDGLLVEPVKHLLLVALSRGNAFLACLSCAELAPISRPETGKVLRTRDRDQTRV